MLVADKLATITRGAYRQVSQLVNGEQSNDWSSMGSTSVWFWNLIVIITGSLVINFGKSHVSVVSLVIIAGIESPVDKLQYRPSIVTAVLFAEYHTCGTRGDTMIVAVVSNFESKVLGLTEISKHSSNSTCEGAQNASVEHVLDSTHQPQCSCSVHCDEHDDEPLMF